MSEVSSTYIPTSITITLNETEEHSEADITQSPRSVFHLCVFLVCFSCCLFRCEVTRGLEATTGRELTGFNQLRQCEVNSVDYAVVFEVGLLQMIT